MIRKRLAFAAIIGSIAFLGIGCHTCRDHCSNRSDRDDRYCSTAGKGQDGRLAAMSNCDSTATSFGQPGILYNDAPVVGSLPGMGTPFRAENELPFPQTIPSPGVPAAPPFAGTGRNAFDARLPK